MNLELYLGGSGGITGARPLAAGPAAPQPKSARSVRRGPTPAELESINHVVSRLNHYSGRSYRPDKRATQNFILPLLRDGYSEHDLCLVVWNEAYRLGRDPDYQRFIQPSTLFGPKKFEERLVAAKAEDAKVRRDTERAKQTGEGGVEWLKGVLEGGGGK